MGMILVGCLAGCLAACEDRLDKHEEVGNGAISGKQPSFRGPSCRRRNTPTASLSPFYTPKCMKGIGTCPKLQSPGHLCGSYREFFHGGSKYFSAFSWKCVPVICKRPTNKSGMSETGVSGSFRCVWQSPSVGRHRNRWEIFKVGTRGIRSRVMRYHASICFYSYSPHAKSSVLGRTEKKSLKSLESWLFQHSVAGDCPCSTKRFSKFIVGQNWAVRRFLSHMR